MRETLRRAALSALWLLWMAVPTGCHIIADGAYRDAQQVIQIPQAFCDGWMRDLENYQRVR